MKAQFALFLAISISAIPAFSAELECSKVGSFQSLATQDDLGTVVAQTGADCEVAKLITEKYRCEKVGNRLLLKPTGAKGTDFYIINIHGEEITYFTEYQKAYDFMMSSDCSGEL